jgi:monofunctional glycosyltransferase
MRLFAKILVPVALWLFGSEWCYLQTRLVREYESRLRHSANFPSVLAQQLLISGEDHRFFSHGGIDLFAICRAIWRRLVLGRREGASTIEMQLVRVITARFEHTMARKIREMFLATLVTRAVPKEALPALYLQLGYFGWRMNGFAAACRHMGLRAEQLTPMDTARLVARLKYPQPRTIQTRRLTQINIRAKHLLSLHVHHMQGCTYLGLERNTRYATV